MHPEGAGGNLADSGLHCILQFIFFNAVSIVLDVLRLAMADHISGFFLLVLLQIAGMLCKVRLALLMIGLLHLLMLSHNKCSCRHMHRFVGLKETSCMCRVRRHT